MFPFLIGSHSGASSFLSSLFTLQQKALSSTCRRKNQRKHRQSQPDNRQGYPAKSGQQHTKCTRHNRCSHIGGEVKCSDQGRNNIAFRKTQWIIGNIKPVARIDRCNQQCDQYNRKYRSMPTGQEQEQCNHNTAAYRRQHCAADIIMKLS